MTRKSRREITREVEAFKKKTVAGEDDLPPVFVEYGPDGEVVTPGLFGVRSREETDE